jgi:hypothetical protein
MIGVIVLLLSAGIALTHKEEKRFPVVMTGAVIAGYWLSLNLPYTIFKNKLEKTWKSQVFFYIYYVMIEKLNPVKQ